MKIYGGFVRDWILRGVEANDIDMSLPDSIIYNQKNRGNWILNFLHHLYYNWPKLFQRNQNVEDDITYITNHSKQDSWRKQYENWIKHTNSSICVVNIPTWFSAKIFIKTPDMIQYRGGTGLDATLLNDPNVGWDRCIHSKTPARNDAPQHRSGDWNKPIEIDIQANIAGPMITTRNFGEDHAMHTQIVGNSSSADNLAIDCHKQILCFKRVLSRVFPSLTMAVYMTLFKMFFLYGNPTSSNPNQKKREAMKERRERLQKRGFFY